jgi:hypothetical protein
VIIPKSWPYHRITNFCSIYLCEDHLTSFIRHWVIVPHQIVPNCDIYLNLFLPDMRHKFGQLWTRHKSKHIGPSLQWNFTKFTEFYEKKNLCKLLFPHIFILNPRRNIRLELEKKSDQLLEFLIGIWIGMLMWNEHWRLGARWERG